MSSGRKCEPGSRKRRRYSGPQAARTEAKTPEEIAESRVLQRTLFDAGYAGISFPCQAGEDVDAAIQAATRNTAGEVLASQRRLTIPVFRHARGTSMLAEVICGRFLHRKLASFCHEIFAELDGLPQGSTGAWPWQDTFLSLPTGLLHERYVDLFTGQ